MASQWLKARQTKYAAYAAVYILVVIAMDAVIVLAFVGYSLSRGLFS